MTQDFEARHAQEDKLIELMKLIREMVADMEPKASSVNVAISKDGTMSLYTGDNRVDVTAFPDGQTYYTSDWDRMLGRTRKETDDDTVRADN